MEHILITDFNHNPNIGLFAYATDTYCLAGRDVPEAIVKKLEKILNVPVHQISLCGTSLIGIFCTGNSKSLLIPAITFKSERDALEKLGIPFTVVDTTLTALGNSVLCNDNGALVNSEFEPGAKKQIAEALGVKVTESKIAGLDILGSLAIVANGRCLVHQDVESFEKKLIEKNLNVVVEEGTVNMGSPYIRSGLIANSSGFAVGNQSGGPEIDHIDHVLGFIE